VFTAAPAEDDCNACLHPLTVSGATGAMRTGTRRALPCAHGKSPTPGHCGGQCWSAITARRSAQPADYPGVYLSRWRSFALPP
jgi:hypothetical protein